jgi:hypothetical protein
MYLLLLLVCVFDCVIRWRGEVWRVRSLGLPILVSRRVSGRLCWLLICKIDFVWAILYVVRHLLRDIIGWVERSRVVSRWEHPSYNIVVLHLPRPFIFDRSFKFSVSHNWVKVELKTFQLVRGHTLLHIWIEGAQEKRQRSACDSGRD